MKDREEKVRDEKKKLEKRRPGRLKKGRSKSVREDRSAKECQIRSKKIKRKFSDVGEARRRQK